MEFKLLVNRIAQNSMTMVVLLGLVVTLGCDSEPDVKNPKTKNEGEQSKLKTKPEQHVDIEALRKPVSDFCADCHDMPLASSFPKSSWDREVDRGYEFYLNSGRTDLTPPVRNDVVAFFKQQAPESLDLTGTTGGEVNSSIPLRISRTILGPATTENPNKRKPPSVANVNVVELTKDRIAHYVYCDMENGDVAVIPVAGDQTTPKLIASFDHPCHVETCDLNGDGVNELLVSELGSYYPEDHQKGKVYLLIQDADSLTFKSFMICDQLGRVADVRGADFDGDGDQDLVVAEFGWLETGNVLLLRNETTDFRQPNFSKEIVDERHGAINVIPTDLDGDGKLDFVTLLSQEFERIVGYLNQGDGKFKSVDLYRSGDPSFGSSGIELVDFDGDQDLDILYVSGDTFDSNFVKPYHGVQWLENMGDLKYKSHTVGKMPGVHRASAADFDLDGDLDLIAVSLLPPKLQNDYQSTDFDSMVIFRNDGDGKFSRNVLEIAKCNYASCKVHDIDKDGDMDLVIGNFAPLGTLDSPRIFVWENETR